MVKNVTKRCHKSLVVFATRQRLPCRYQVDRALRHFVAAGYAAFDVQTRRFFRIIFEFLQCPGSDGHATAHPVAPRVAVIILLRLTSTLIFFFGGSGVFPCGG